MLQVGDKVVMNRNGNFSNKKGIVECNWWRKMEDLGALTVCTVESENIDTDGSYSITFVEIEFRALNTWVERVG